MCSLDVAFMFATVCGRPREARVAVPMVSSAKGVTLEVSNVALLCFAWQVWHFLMFCNVSKIALCGRRKTFASF